MSIRRNDGEQYPFVIIIRIHRPRYQTMNLGNLRGQRWNRPTLPRGCLSTHRGLTAVLHCQQYMRGFGGTADLVGGANPTSQPTLLYFTFTHHTLGVKIRGRENPTPSRGRPPIPSPTSRLRPFGFGPPPPASLAASALLNGPS